MCGIAGWLGWNRSHNEHAVSAMLDGVAHRGPDAQGLAHRDFITLGHRRLSVIEPSRASDQPMRDLSGRCWIVYNGELYNYKTLRSELLQLGARFRTESDTEVILEAYKAWGQRCLEKFNGMFAFALWDEADQSLLFARDRMGEKPLFYMLLEDGVAFASELQALLAHPDCKKTVDVRRLGYYLALSYSSGEQTLIEGIKRLPAASSLTFRRGEAPKLQSYWQLAPHYLEKRRIPSVAEAAAELRELLDDSVKLRLMSDVPIGAFLSGGIDSSAIAAAMARQMPREQVKTFTMGFSEKSFDETFYARRVAEHLGVSHAETRVIPTPAMLERALDIASNDPLADTSIIPMTLLAQFTREHVTVALSGDGGDECFGGYETYIADKLHAPLHHLPRWLVHAAQKASMRLPASYRKVGFDFKLQQFLRGLSLSSAQAHCSWRVLFSPQELQALFQPDWQAELASGDVFSDSEQYFRDLPSAHFLDRAMYADTKSWMVDDVLAKVDRATMAWGLESRAPFLDHRIVEFAAALPVEYKVRGLTLKYLLKRSQAERLPAFVLNRGKRGFNAPLSHWFLHELKDYAQAHLHSPHLLEFIRPEAIDKLWNSHQNRTRDNGFRLFSILCLSLWLQKVAASEAPVFRHR